MRTAITHNLYEVDGAVSATDFASGPKLPLGTLAGFGPSDADVELYYVEGNGGGPGAPEDGNVVGEGDPQYEPAATDEAVVSFGGTGPSTWVYVKAASALRRGQAVVPAAVSAPRVVEAAAAALGSERVVVIMGSGVGAAEEAVTRLVAEGEKVGLLKVRLYRPFSAERLLATLPDTVKTIGVLDRTKEPGADGECAHGRAVDGSEERLARAHGGATRGGARRDHGSGGCRHPLLRLRHRRDSGPGHDPGQTVHASLQKRPAHVSDRTKLCRHHQPG